MIYSEAVLITLHLIIDKITNEQTILNINQVQVILAHLFLVQWCHVNCFLSAHLSVNLAGEAFIIGRHNIF